MRYLYIILFSVFTAFSVHAAPHVRVDAAVRDSLAVRLKRAHCLTDSLPAALNLFDACAGQPGNERNGELAYRLAMRQRDYNTALDVLLLLANEYNNDEAKLTSLLKRAQKLNVEGRSEAAAFLRLRRTMLKARQLSGDSLIQTATAVMKKYNSRPPSNELYTRIEELFTLCIYMHSLFDQNDLLGMYYDQLGELLSQLPQNEWALRTVYYHQAAVSFTRQMNPARAVEADRALIQALHRATNRYANTDRIYRSFDYNLYIAYLRLMANYRVLKPAEVEQYYREIVEISKRNERVADEFVRLRRADIWHHMARKEYAQAVPLLLEQVDKPEHRNIGLELNHALRDAARAIGNDQAEIIGGRNYVKYLEEYIHSRAGSKLAELGAIYDLRATNAQIQQLKDEGAAQAQKSHMTIIWITSIGLVMAVVGACFCLMQWRRVGAASVKLKQANEELRHQRDDLERAQSDLILARDRAKAADRQKGDFINTIAHQVKAPLEALAEYTGLIVDCMEPEKQRYLQRYSNIVELNTELILSLVNDITEISALEANRLEVKIRVADLQVLCRTAIDTVQHLVPPGMSIVLADLPSVMVATDQRRLEQILVNLLENAMKFAEKGTVSVSYSVDYDRRRFELSVTDQGRGIPPAKQEEIFDRFVKLDPEAPGMGLGLYVTRLLAQLMGGEVHVDRSYTKGARFVVSIPLGRCDS